MRSTNEQGGRSRRRFGALNPAFAAAHGIKVSVATPSKGAKEEDAAAESKTTTTARHSSAQTDLEANGKRLSSGPTVITNSCTGGSGVRTKTFSHAISSARESGRLIVVDLGLTSPLPSQCFDLRSGLAVDLSMDGSSSGVGSSNKRPWDCHVEETLTLVDFSDNNLSSGHGSTGSLDERIGKYKSLRTLRAKRCGLSSIPLPVISSSLSNLSTLDLARNRINHKFPLWVLPPTLQELDLSENNIPSLYGDVEDEVSREVLCPNLTRLNVSNNALIKLFPSFHGNKGFPKLRTIQFCHNRIRSLPSPLDCVFANETTLQTFEGSKNCIANPVDLSGMQGVRIVDLSNNRLRKPPLIGCNVVRLNLSDNGIVNLNGLFKVDGRAPKLFRSDLVELHLRQNKVAELHSEIMSVMTKLTLLDVGRNDLTDLPYILGYLPVLRKIVLDGNALRTLRHAMSDDVDVPALKQSLRRRGHPPEGDDYLTPERDGMIDDSCSPSSSVSGYVGAGAGTSVVDDRTGMLNLSKRGLHAFPEEVTKELRRCQHHYGNDNEDVLSLGHRVKAVNLRENKLQTLHDNDEEDVWLSAIPLASSLDAGKNRLEKISSFSEANVDDLPPLQSIILDGNRLTSEAVESSFLCRRSQSSMPKRTIDNPTLWQSLSYLDLSSNRLEWLPPGLFHLQSLTTLILSYNRLKYLDDGSSVTNKGGWLPGFPSLENLDVSNNRIESLGNFPSIIGGCCPHLKSLLLNNNDLRMIPPELGLLGVDWEKEDESVSNAWMLKSRNNLRTLDLRGNPQKSIRPAMLERVCDDILLYLRGRLSDGAVRVAREAQKRAAVAMVKDGSGTPFSSYVNELEDKVHKKAEEASLAKSQLVDSDRKASVTKTHHTSNSSPQRPGDNHMSNSNMNAINPPSSQGQFLEQTHIETHPPRYAGAEKTVVEVIQRKESEDVIRKLRVDISNMENQLREPALSQAKRYALKKTLAMQRSELIRAKRNLKSSSGGL